MGRGMNLSEFREALASDASIENEKLKKELELLKKESSEKINELEEELNHFKKMSAQLSKRCYAMTRGMLCVNCTHKYPDCKYGMTYADEEAMYKFVRENKLDMRHDPSAHVKVLEYLQERRSKRFGI